MELEIFENPYSPVAEPPQFCSDSVQNHPIIDLHSFNQDLESAFSRLAISSASRSMPQCPPLYHGHPSTVSDVLPFETPPLPLPPHHPLYWGLPQSSAGAAPTTSFLRRQSSADAASSSENQSCSYFADGPFGFRWAHQEINVGPDDMWPSGSSPYLLDGRDRLMNIHQRQDFNSDDFVDYYSTVLHGKEQISRNSIPILPFALQQQGNAGSLYNNPQLYNRNQELIIRGRIVSLAKDQKWSSVLNSKLDEGLSEQEIEMFLSEVLDFSGDLLSNQFGSQFFQKFFAACNEDQRTWIIISLFRLPSNFTKICLNSYGARSIQKLLGLMTPRQISFFVSALVPCASALSTDTNGQHVIQHCVKKFSTEYVEQLIIEIANNCFQIGTNKSGCCVIQLCVENSTGDARKRLISEIIANAVHLAEDPYGNYVVQHLLEMKSPEATINLMTQFMGRFVSLSCNKFASNVVEKFLLLSGEDISKLIILELIQNGPMLFLDPYGNFVIQTALSVANGAFYAGLVKMIRENAASMQSNIYGKKVLDWLQKNREYHV